MLFHQDADYFAEHGCPAAAPKDLAYTLLFCFSSEIYKHWNAQLCLHLQKPLQPLPAVMQSELSKFLAAAVRRYR